MKVKLSKFSPVSSTKIITNLGIGKQGKVQLFIDNEVVRFLRNYVSKDTGTQEGMTQRYRSGLVVINVPYARFQAYSPTIKKRNGKRGTYPFERMKADKKSTILRSTASYSRRLNK